jgi:glycerol kinase
VPNQTGHILCIDQSTSATKALLFNVAGTLLGQHGVEHRQIYAKPGWVEHDAAEIWRNVKAAVSGSLDKSPAATREPICLSLTNQRETFVVFDRSTGEPLRNAVVWQCRRGEVVCDEMRHAGHDEVVRRKTGLRLDSYFSGSKLAWLMRNEPDVARKIRAGDALVGTIDAYLVYRLTGGNVFATDHTNASRTLLYDINSLGWDDELCELFGVPKSCLPEVRESTATFGTTDVCGLLPKPVPICGVMGDSQAALFAHACFQPGEAKVSFGTGSSVLLNIGHRPREAAGGAVTSLAWVVGGVPMYCFEGIINYSAATVAWLKDQLKLVDDLRNVEAIAGSVNDNGGVYLVPAFVGMGAPYWNASARAAISGLSAGSGQAHVVRAALESIAYQIRDVLDMMRGGSGVDLRAIHADGGPTSNKLLMQFTADMAQIDVLVADMPACSALGAAMAGALGRGLYRSLDELAALTRDAQPYRPAMAKDQIERNYRGWQRAVRAVLAASGSEEQR